MPLGVGVFLGMLCLCLVLLFNSTKDRWNWRRIVRWTLGAPIVLVLIGAVVYWGVSAYQDRPRVERDLWGLSPGLDASEVVFRKGAPTDSSGNLWRYRASERWGPTHFVQMHGGKVWCIFEDADGSGSIQGLGSWSDQKAIEAKFGTPTLVSNSEDKLRRTLSFSRFCVVFELEQDRVERFGVYDPKIGPPAYEADSL